MGDLGSYIQKKPQVVPPNTTMNNFSIRKIVIVTCPSD